MLGKAMVWVPFLLSPSRTARKLSYRAKNGDGKVRDSWGHVLNAESCSAPTTECELRLYLRAWASRNHPRVQ